MSAVEELVEQLGPLRLPRQYIEPEPTIKQEIFLRSQALECFFGGAAGPGKLQRLDEAVPTPTGWTTIGEIEPGDFVFGADGSPTVVLAVSAVDPAPEAFRFTFDDGSSIESSADHLWLTFDAAELAALTRRDPEWRAVRRAKRPARASASPAKPWVSVAVKERNRAANPSVTLEAPTGTVRTTREIVASLTTKRGRRNHAIQVSEPLDLPERDLPLDPYLLGVWLGDGTTSDGAVTSADPEVFEAFVAAGFQIGYSTRYTKRLLGLRTVLRTAGLLGQKHIPVAYQRASIAQRRALLEGLMDSDGYAGRDGVEFTNTNERLVRDVYELVTGLGQKVRLAEGRATLNGRDCGPKWRITWAASIPVFRLQRKLVAQVVSSRRTTRFRYIVAAQRVPSTPMRCIRVGNASSLYLIGRAMIPTHNSWGLLMAAAQYVDLPGYHALLLRPALTEFELPGGLIPVSHDWWAGKAAWNGSKRSWTFPSGSTVSFGYLGNLGDLSHYKGPSYMFCVARGTGIRMGDGTVRPIEDVRVGDEVMTLEGPRPVTRTHAPVVKPVARISTPQGESVVSMEHRVLTAFGWVSPSELLPSLLPLDEPTLATSPGLRLGWRTRLVPTLWDRRLAPRQRPKRHPEAGPAATSGSPEDAGTCCEASEDARRGSLPPPLSTVQLVLHVPARRPGRLGAAPESEAHAFVRALTSTLEAEGSPPGYPMCAADRHDGSARLALAGAPGGTPSRGDSGACTRSSWRRDDPGNTRSRRRREGAPVWALHPYTKASLDMREAVQVRSAGMARAGEAEVLDLTVAGASHYITDAGIVSSNCGFDELTSFSEGLYRGMFRVLRRPRGVLEDVPVRARSASNPGDVGHCVPYGDVLTPAGWRPIEEMHIGDPVYAVQADGSLVASTVEQTHRHVADEVVEVEARGLRMAMTPEHRVAKVGGTREGRGSLFTLVPFEDLPGQATVLRSVAWQGTPFGPVSAPRPAGLGKARRAQPEMLGPVQYARFLGWYLTEGCLIERDRSVSIAQSKPASRARLRAFLEGECGFTVSWSAHQATIYAPGWYEHLRAVAPGLCRDKAIPRFLLDGPPDALEAFLDAALDGDGHRVGTGGQFYTTSRQLADDVAEVAVKLGYVVGAHSRQRANRQGLSYCVNLTRRKAGGTEILTGQHRYDVSTFTARRSRIVRRPGPTPVYCIGVPDHHAFVLRQNGSVWVSGNSWVRSRMIDPRTRQAGVDYVRATISDNPFLDYDEYLQTLQHMSPVDRERLIKGDWDVMEEGGKFRRANFRVIEPEEVTPSVRAVRYWDLAATKPSPSNPDPDWTVGLRLDVDRSGTYTIRDLVALRDEDAEVEATVRLTAELDGRAVPIAIEQDPGQAGKSQLSHYSRNVLNGYAVSAGHTKIGGKNAAKEVRARPAAAAVANGLVRLVRGPNAREFLDQVSLFPGHGDHDDYVDALSGAFNKLNRGGMAPSQGMRISRPQGRIPGREGAF